MRSESVALVVWACTWCTLAIVLLHGGVWLLAAISPRQLDVVGLGLLELLVLGGVSLFAADQHRSPSAQLGPIPLLEFLGPGRGRVTELALGFALGLAIKPSADVLRALIERRFPTDESELAARAALLAYDDWLGLASLFVMIGLLGPIVEELLYRGLAFRLLQRGAGRMAALVVTSVFFVSAHGAIRDWLPLFWVACCLGLARCHTERIWACIGAHVAFNCAALAMVVARHEIDYGVGLGHPIALAASLLLVVGVLSRLRRFTA